MPSPALRAKLQFRSGMRATLMSATETAEHVEPAESQEGRPLLLVDDDELHCIRTGRALEARGFQIVRARNLAEARRVILLEPPAFAVLEMRLRDGLGLSVIEALLCRRPDSRAVVLTAFGSIANAIAAVRLGAADYLTKPANGEDLTAALLGHAPANGMALKPMTADRARWEHIHRVLEFSGYNISEAARRLGLHRRTLQRILAKRAPR